MDKETKRFIWTVAAVFAFLIAMHIVGNYLERTKMPRQANNLTPEQIEDVKRDLVAGKNRTAICKERGYTYQQLQRALGFAWKKKPEIVVTAEVSTTETA